MTLLEVNLIFAEDFHNMEPDLCDKYECCEGCPNYQADGGCFTEEL